VYVPQRPLARSVRVPYHPFVFGMGIGELMVVLVIVLVVFGAGRLPEVMGSLGKGVQQFKRGLKEPPEIDVTPETPAATKDERER
jgi:sec-independent protein translocase protein TatA